MGIHLDSDTVEHNSLLDRRNTDGDQPMLKGGTNDDHIRRKVITKRLLS